MEPEQDKIEYWAEESLKPNVEAAAWFLLLTHTQVQKETDPLKELLGKVESEFEDLENFQCIHSPKKKKKEEDYSEDMKGGSAPIWEGDGHGREPQI